MITKQDNIALLFIKVEFLASFAPARQSCNYSHVMDNVQASGGFAISASFLFTLAVFSLRG